MRRNDINSALNTRYFGLLVLILLLDAVHAAPPAEITARAYALMDAASGRILLAKEPHTRLPPASTTKVLTTLVALDHINLNTKVTVSARAAQAAPTRIGFKPGESLYVEDVLYALMLRSGNDAAEVVAEAIGGSVPEFAALMNLKAWQLGARDSQFRNPHGLPDDNHYSSVYDMALIFRAAMLKPAFAEIARTRAASLRIEGQGVSVREVEVRSTNRLLTSYDGALGGKTGYTKNARHCFVGEATRGPVRLIVSLFGSANRTVLFEDAKIVLEQGFAQYGLAESDDRPLTLPVDWIAITDPLDETDYQGDIDERVAPH